jgi:hypothetical protein
VGVSYYTVSNHAYFLGTVALLNSLRVTGNDGQLVVLDAGLTPEERSALKAHANVVSVSEDRGHPVLLKPFPYLLGSSGVIVVLDSDIIVTSSLTPITSLAQEGKICVCPAWEEKARTRWFPEWEDTLRLRAPLRREDWVHDGVVVFDTAHWPDLLERWWEVCSLVPPSEIFANGAPFNAGDADALNALLMSEVPREGLAILPPGEEVFAGNVRIDDVETLACSVDGRSATFIHVPDRPKPWENRGWLRHGAAVYLQLMRRLLFGSDATLRLDAGRVPIWLRPGLRGKLALPAIGGVTHAFVSLAQRVPDPVRERLRRLRREVA